MLARLGRVNSTRLLGLHSVRTTTPIYHNLFPRSTLQFSTSTRRQEENRGSQMEKVRNATAKEGRERRGLLVETRTRIDGGGSAGDDYWGCINIYVCWGLLAVGHGDTFWTRIGQVQGAEVECD